jgi:hypothetical protein
MCERMKSAAIIFLLLATLTNTGCFHPAIAAHDTVPPKNSIPSPYDEVWDATLEVIKSSELKVQAQDPVHGIVEALGGRFTLQDADCGTVNSLMSKNPAVPTYQATQEFNFYLKPDGPEATSVEIEATFSTPGNAPFHPVTNLNCISTGRKEARLLKEIKRVSAEQRRPVFKPSSAP